MTEALAQVTETFQAIEKQHQAEQAAARKAREAKARAEAKRTQAAADALGCNRPQQPRRNKRGRSFISLCSASACSETLN